MYIYIIIKNREIMTIQEFQNELNGHNAIIIELCIEYQNKLDYQSDLRSMYLEEQRMIEAELENERNEQFNWDLN